MMASIGIMGGTFDPPHHGHLAAAEEARYRLGLSRVLWIPNGIPPHKTHDAVSLVCDRVEMVRLAIEGNARFELCEIEVERDGPSYTVDTLGELQRRLAGEDLVFLMGSDEFANLYKWRASHLLPQLARLGVLVRGGVEVRTSEVERSVPEVCGRYSLVSVPDLPISSSELRGRVRAGIPVQYLVPEAVRDYIEARGLYRE